VILVTGGAGFIGAQLVRQLADAGAPVRVFELPGVGVAHLPPRVEVVRGDVRRRSDVQAAVQGCERVFHLAANAHMWARDPRDLDAVNCEGTRHVLEEALRAGARRIVHVSTESILTAREGGSAEDMTPHERDLCGPYCVSKLRAEQEALRLAAAGAPIVVATPTLPVGPGDRGQTPPTRMTVAFCRGRLPGLLDGSVDLVDARDAAAGLRAAMDVGQPGRRYVISGTPGTLRGWLAEVGRVVGRAAPRANVPYPAALAAAHLAEWWARHVTREPPLATVTGVRLTRALRPLDASASRAALGLGARPLDESARDAVAFYREMGWI